VPTIPTPFTWLVQIVVHESLVADGIDITDEVAQSMVERRFPLAAMSGLSAHVVKAPAPSRIREAQRGDLSAFAKAEGGAPTPSPVATRALEQRRRREARGSK